MTPPVPTRRAAGAARGLLRAAARHAAPLAFPLIAGALALLLITSAWRLAFPRNGPAAVDGGVGMDPSQLAALATFPEPPGRTLVLYVYRPRADAEAPHNLGHFLLRGIGDGQHSCCNYVILVHKADTDAAPLPQLPKSARYLYHDRPCGNWGLIGWALSPSGGGLGNSGSSSSSSSAGYDRYIFLSSRVRGPFLPAYMRPLIHWTHPFTSRLTQDVKLVTSTLSCGTTRPPKGQSGAARYGPRVTLGAVATDQEGLALLLADGQALACHTSHEAEAYHSEAGVPTAILKAHFNLDTLLSKFQGVDWRDSSNWGCNSGVDPAGTNEFGYDGTWLSPHEAMFVPVTAPLLQLHLPGPSKAAKLSAWETEEVAERAASGGGDGRKRGGASVARISSNDYKANTAHFKLPRILAGLVRGMHCFDIDYFVDRNPDVRSHVQLPHVVWRFFVFVGQFEDRPYRYSCEGEWDKVVPPAPG